MSKWKKVALWKKILIGVVIGLIIGLVSPKAAEVISPCPLTTELPVLQCSGAATRTISGAS